MFFYIVVAMLAYPGGKRKQLKLIEKHLPDVMPAEVFDPFGGGGSVSMWLAEKFPESTIHFNDLKAVLPGLMDVMRDEAKTDELCAALEAAHIHTKEDRRPYMERSATDPAAFVIASATGFRNQAESVTPVIKNGKIEQPERRIPCIRKISAKLQALPNIRTSAIDGLEIVENNKDKECFIYLDPPYAGTRHLYGGFSPSSIFCIADIMRDPKTIAKIMLQLDFTGGTFDIFGAGTEGKNRSLIKWWGRVNYALSGDSDHYKRLYNDYQIIATNY